MEQLSSHLAANLAELNARFGRSADFYAKELELYHCKGAIVLFDGMASLKGLWQLLLDAASRRTPPGPAEQLTGEQVFALLFEHSALPAEPAPVENWDALIRRLTAGMAVLLLDGCAKGIAFSVQSLNARSVDEPAGEGNLRGSREGFADLLRVNTSLLRRCFRNDALVIEIGQADCEMKTEYALCYCRDTADPKAVQKVRQTLQRARPQLLLDSSYFVPWLFPCKIRTFAPVRYTERPIVAAAKLREGKFVILVNGSPSALILPTLFCENFECLDDYAGTAYFASFLRVLKYISFYLSIFLPGVFVCWAVYLPELLPPQLLFKIEAAEQATPLPLFGEMLLVILMLEIIREAGLRMPQTLGHSVSLIAALIIGDAAIAAGLMSTPVILTAAAASIAVFVTPSLYEVATVLRLVVLLAAGVAGRLRTGRVIWADPGLGAGCALPAGCHLPRGAALAGRCDPAQLPKTFLAALYHLAKTRWLKLERSCFSEKTLTLSVLTAEFARCVLQTGAPVTARSFLLRGLPMTLALVLITALTAGAEQRADSFGGTDLRSRVVCGGLGLWFVWEAVETFRQAQELCWENFSSMAMLGLLPLLLWAGWKLEPSVLVRCAPILCWAAALAGLLCLLGLNGQFHWEKLMLPTEPVTLTLPLYPEYFALPLFCPAKQVRGAVWLPVKAFILVGSFALCTELVFGAGNALPGIELLRAGRLGSISRFDALVLLVWLAAAMFRFCVLVQVVRQLAGRMWGRATPAEENA